MAEIFKVPIHMSLGEMFLSPTVLSIPFPSLASEIRNNMKYLLFYLVAGLETATPCFLFLPEGQLSKAPWWHNNAFDNEEGVKDRLPNLKMSGETESINK